jgi:hypothetical protein
MREHKYQWKLVSCRGHPLPDDERKEKNYERTINSTNNRTNRKI